MIGFADETYIDVSSGNGGAGCVSFRREKYVPRGGPDGGDGGDGGDVVFVVRENLRTLVHLKHKRVYRAQNGDQGRKKKQTGRRGADAIIAVPPGTLIKDPFSGRIFKDLTGLEKWRFLKGGKGGRGNVHFAGSKRQAPRYAQPGLPGAQLRVQVELRLIADIGLVGLPNAGKSSLICALTKAKSEIGDFPFTTKTPRLGVLTHGDAHLVLADIPGIIKGAALGAGLGLKFLRHIERTRALLFLIDLENSNFLNTFAILTAELSAYAPALLEKPRLVVGSKLDLLPGLEELTLLRQALGGEKVLGISSHTRQGLDVLIKKTHGLINGGKPCD